MYLCVFMHSIKLSKLTYSKIMTFCFFVIIEDLVKTNYFDIYRYIQNKSYILNE